MSSSELLSKKNQSTQEVLLLLEKSKIESDKAIDNLPGLYVVIDEEGEVLRVNSLFQESLYDGKSKQKINFFDYIPEGEIDDLKMTMALAKKFLEQKFSIELNLQLPQDLGLNYVFTLYAWKIQSDKTVLTLLGKDVTEIKKSVRRKALLETEVKSIEQIQKIMLPSYELSEKNFDLSCYYQASAQCGGDFLHYSFEDNKLRVWFGDVTGHGVGPAMIVGAIRSAVSVLEEGAPLSPEESLVKINKCIRDITAGEYWMTFQIIEFDFENELLKMAQAAHTSVFKVPLINVDEKDRSFTDAENIISGSSAILGSSEKPKIYLHQEKLIPGTVYLCFSDGLPELKDSNDKYFGDRKTLNSYIQSLDLNQDIKIAKEDLFKEANLFKGNEPFQDDISFWSVLYKGI